MTPARTQDEIAARVEATREEDFLGWKIEVFIPHLDYTHARPWLKDTATPESWAADREADPSLEQQARGYLDFAVGKIQDHRGISAERSTVKLSEYAWLLGRDDVVTAMEAAEYAQYGAPKVKVFAEMLGWPWPDDDPELARMAEGLPCVPGCESGCGQ